MSVIFILAAVLAIAATVLAFIFITPDKKREKLNNFGKFLHDALNFKFLIVDKILQAMYILATAYTVLLGFFMLFYVQEGYSGYYYSSPDQWYGGYGILIMILGPIAVRLVYELAIMAVLLVKNVIQINNKLGGNAAEPVEASVEEAPVAEEAAPRKVSCTNCGAPKEEGAFCTNCGHK